jgi:hypothetical protein
VTDRQGQTIVRLGPVIVDASNVALAEAAGVGGSPPAEWVVTFELDDEGTAAFAEATGAAAVAEPPHNQIAIVLDGEVISVPVVQEPITSGRGQISSGFTEEEATALAERLDAGATAAPATSPIAEPEGQDIGMGTNWCEVQTLGGLDLLGDGTPSTAWTGYPVNAEGQCPRNMEWLVAVDVTGDELADAAWGPIDGCQYLICTPLGATDLDGDGDEELVVQKLFSIVEHAYFSVRPGSEVPFVVEPIRVAAPGHPAANIESGGPLLTSAGGDEGYASWMRCEGYPEAPVLVWTWTNHPVDSSQPAEWHETKLRLEDDGMFHVVGTNDFELDADQDPGLEISDRPACGLPFDYWASPLPD